ncbi:hypothetical protein G6F65_017786 [Rhizopus arrhizus]|nr:hypothetical protein G6F65_017786 [Rhizopus arrhizus]
MPSRPASVSRRGDRPRTAICASTWKTTSSAAAMATSSGCAMPMASLAIPTPATATPASWTRTACPTRWISQGRAVPVICWWRASTTASRWARATRSPSPLKTRSPNWPGPPRIGPQ